MATTHDFAARRPLDGGSVLALRRIGGRLLRGDWLGPYRALALVLAATLAAFGLLRLTMLIVYADRALLDAATLLRVMWVGLRFDLLVGLILLLWQALHLLVAGDYGVRSPICRGWLEFEWIFASLLLPLTWVVELTFFDEFQSRLNYVAFEYLVYPTEVCCNIWESYAVVPWLSVVVACGSATYFLSRRTLLGLIVSPAAPGLRFGIPVAMLVAIAGLQRTTDMDSRQVSPDRVAVECAGNGLYSFVYYAWTCRIDFDESYATLGTSEAVAELRRSVVAPGDRRVEGSSNPVDRVVTTGRPRRDWNVVLILEESFGAEFVASLGGEDDVTPNFDALCREGILFDDFYATGNRTARALEAVMTSMPPIPTESILKRERSDRVHTLANVLADRGYRRLFLTGGRGLFDGVRSFMTRNGFDQFGEQSDVRQPVFENAWGVSDEDLFRHALGELDRLHAAGRPFFATLLTVSNHRPFTYPAGRIPETAPTRFNAVKYADWALGRFFREAEAHEFHRDTLFVVMGDHGARVAGSQFFPIASYRVPMLLISPDGAGRGERRSTLGCSLDVAPTILGRLGGEYRSVFFGRDLLRIRPEDGLALMQHNHDVAGLDPQGRMAILGSNRSVRGFALDRATCALRSTPQPHPPLLRTTAALFQSAFDLYYAERWRPDAAVPPSSSPEISP